MVSWLDLGVADPKGQIRDVAQSPLFEVDLLQEETIKSAAAAWGETPLDLLTVAAGVGPEPHDMWEHTAEVLVEKFRVNTVLHRTRLLEPSAEAVTNGVPFLFRVPS